METIERKIKKAIKRELFTCGLFGDVTDAIDIAEEIQDDVVRDIVETADEDFNDSDVRIAIVRALRQRLGI